MQKPSFSGHESFVCRQFWLKKGFDYANSNQKFTSDTAVVDLGVGKNMVSSIRFWLKAFSLVDEDDELSSISKYLFSNTGKDPYLEDEGTLWLLHYHLIKSSKATIYDLVFNEFRKERVGFTKEQLLNFIYRKCEEADVTAPKAKTLNSDISVLLRSYIKPTRSEGVSIEDDFSSVLIDLNLIKHTKRRNADEKLIDWYSFESSDRSDLPYQIILYTILDVDEERTSFTFRDLLIGKNSPGLIFALNAESLHKKINEIVERHPEISYSETAGNQVLQLSSRPDKWEILNEYYDN